jgi:hypothetical protein
MLLVVRTRKDLLPPRRLILGRRFGATGWISEEILVNGNIFGHSANYRPGKRDKQVRPASRGVCSAPVFPLDGTGDKWQMGVKKRVTAGLLCESAR